MVSCGTSDNAPDAKRMEKMEKSVTERPRKLFMSRVIPELGGLIEKSYPLVTAVLFAFPISFTTKDTKDTKDTKSTKRLDNEALDPVL